MQALSTAENTCQLAHLRSVLQPCYISYVCEHVRGCWDFGRVRLCLLLQVRSSLVLIQQLQRSIALLLQTPSNLLSGSQSMLCQCCYCQEMLFVCLDVVRAKLPAVYVVQISNHACAGNHAQTMRFISRPSVLIGKALHYKACVPPRLINGHTGSHCARKCRTKYQCGGVKQ